MFYPANSVFLLSYFNFKHFNLVFVFSSSRVNRSNFCVLPQINLTPHISYLKSNLYTKHSPLNCLYLSLYLTLSVCIHVCIFVLQILQSSHLFFYVFIYLHIYNPKSKKKSRIFFSLLMWFIKTKHKTYLPLSNWIIKFSIFLFFLYIHTYIHNVTFINENELVGVQK